MTDRTGAIARTVLAAQSDERLVRLLREGHRQAFDEIVGRYRGPLVGFATAIVSHDRAEDVVQTALERAHRALLADDREINLRPWLFTIVRNASLNLIRSEPAVDELDSGLSAAAGSEPEQVAERNDEMNRLFTAICALPTAQREALVRRELEGVGHGEIASQLGTTATAVRGLIFRARTQLRNAMGALVPFPLLRALAAEGSAAGVAGGGAGVALFGGAGAKGGAAVAAAVLALGAGIAVERNRGADRDGDVAVAQAAADHAPPGGRSPGRRTEPAEAAGPPSRRGEDPSGDHAGGSGSQERDGDRPADAGASGAQSPTGAAGGGGAGSSPGGHHGGSAPGSGEDGPAGSAPEPQDHEDDDSGPGSDNSGSGDDDPPDHEDPPEAPEAPEVEEPEHDSSGHGDGLEDADDERSPGGAEPGRP